MEFKPYKRDGKLYLRKYKLLRVLYYQPEEKWTIEHLIQYHIPLGWYDFFTQNKEMFKYISQGLEDFPLIYPLKKNIFRAFHLTPLDKVKVVIFGQDPYHDTFNGEPVAQGLCFSVPNGKNLNPSLRNIRKAISRNFPDIILSPNGDLTHWARQGILLLNKTLTVIPGKPNNHSMSMLWEPFTRAVIKELNGKNVIFVLWGAEAKKLKPYINPSSPILEHCHPVARQDAFLSCNHFSEINKLLNTEIDWSM